SVPPYIRCAHQSAPLHQLSPSECPFTSGIPITLPPYIRYSRQCPLTLKVPLSIIFPHQSAPLYHITHQSAPFHHMCPSECPFPQYVPPLT
ncbi:unnamed protein product, partial [Staurois parvus]